MITADDREAETVIESFSSGERTVTDLSHMDGVVSGDPCSSFSTILLMIRNPELGSENELK